MSCANSANLIGRAASRLGISWLSSKSGYTSGGTVQVSFFGPQSIGKRPEKEREGGKPRPDNANTQISFFNHQVGDNQEHPCPKAPSRPPALPTQRQISVINDFSADELQVISVQLRLGGAAAARQIQELNGGVLRGIGHSDPRPLDWARSDRKNYQFLIDQLDEVEQGRGYLDTRTLNKEELVDLWAFARFEADRAMRNIDHLQAGLSHLKGPTAEYLTGQHRLEARFYAFLAGQLETMLPAAAKKNKNGPSPKGIKEGNGSFIHH